ncbi:MAG TPA: hypothetical protein DEA79_15970 [Cyanobacteria bacterium UBA11153]|nr:hypothetical protein [Cyanobacteria bacterium UBA11153]
MFPNCQPKFPGQLTFLRKPNPQALITKVNNSQLAYSNPCYELLLAFEDLLNTPATVRKRVVIERNKSYYAISI